MMNEVKTHEMGTNLHDSPYVLNGVNTTVIEVSLPLTGNQLRATIYFWKDLF